MRKKRSQYKVCGRLGYNARLRLWSGKKKKWQKLGRFVEGEQKKGVNPVTILSNKERRGEANRRSNGWRRGQQVKTKNPSRIRRKDVHGRIQAQKTGRKRRYGGVKTKRIRKDLQEQRKVYKESKALNERRYRKGRRRGEFDLMNQTDRSRQSRRRGRVKQIEQVNRRAGTEVRVDRRRWRSGRVPTLQMGRDLIEHGYVSYVDEIGKRGKDVEWQGERLQVGHGMKIKEDVWKNLKRISRNLLEKEEYRKTARPYREVDYLTGMRVLLRQIGSNEVVIPKGMDLSSWKRF